MLNDLEFLHGAALFRLINYGEKITITPARENHSSLYLVETDSIRSAILFKVSKKATSAWSFTLSSQEESTLNTLHFQYPSFSAFIALICHKDGICCLAEDRLRRVLYKDARINGQHISVSRQPRGSYHVRGPSRQLIEQTVPQTDWPRIVLSPSKSSHE